jgi:lipoyl(octanoyl) transferase
VRIFSAMRKNALSGINISGGSPQWRHFDGLQPYAPLVQSMQEHAAAIRAEGAAEAVWLLQHEAVYTGGTSARDADLLAPGDVPALRNGRGGQWTYHGPGQRIAYVMLDIAARGHDVRALVHGLESWVIASLADCGVAGHRRDGLPGIWVQTGNSPSGMDKIAAIGIRISRWVSWHGLAINLDPELAAFDAIVPCGVRDGGVTSLAALGVQISMPQLDQRLQARFHDFF